MSLHSRPWPQVPAVTAQVARAAFAKEGSLPIRIRDELGGWYEDGDFAGAYPVRGKPGLSPAQLAMVTVLQFTEDLTDRQAADAVRGRVDWKYCLGLELADPGFEFTVLSGFRDRLLAGGAERVIFDGLLARVKELGLVGAGGRQRTDSTHVLGRIRDLNRLELAGESVRAALEALAAAAPGWLAGVIDASCSRCTGSGSTRCGCPRARPPASSWRCSTAGTATTCWDRSMPRARRAGWPPARGAGAAADLDPAVLPGHRRGRGEGDLAGGRRARPAAGQSPDRLPL